MFKTNTQSSVIGKFSSAFGIIREIKWKARFGSDGGSLKCKIAKSEVLFPRKWKPN